MWRGTSLRLRWQTSSAQPVSSASLGLAWPLFTIATWWYQLRKLEVVSFLIFLLNILPNFYITILSNNEKLMKWQKLVLLADLLIAHTLLALLFQSGKQPQLRGLSSQMWNRAPKLTSSLVRAWLEKVKIWQFVRKLGNHGHWKCPKTSLIFYPLMTNQKKTEPELRQPHDWPQMRSTKVTFHEFKKAPRHLAHPALLSFLSSDWMMGCASYNSMKLSDESGEVFENGASEFWGSNRGSRCGPCIVTPLHILLLTAF